MAKPHWISVDHVPDLAPDVIHAWWIPLTIDAAQIEGCRSKLIPTERKRADRFLMDRHRIRFIVGRAHMRTILAGYLGIQPIDLPLCYQQLGKPYLDPHANPRGLQFNFSNSQDGGLLAVAQGRSSIGVDLEELKYHRDFLGLAARYFHPSETLAVQRGSVAEQTESFYRCWTRKEAFLKAIGKGLTFPLRDVVVTCERHESAMIRAIQDDAERAITWCVEHLTPMYGYIGALVYEAPRLTLQQFAWRRPHG